MASFFALAAHLLDLRQHVIDGGFDFIVGQREVATPGRHHALFAGQAFNRMLVKRVFTLRNARLPFSLRADHRSATRARTVADETGFFIH